jgi:hypothetical protein
MANINEIITSTNYNASYSMQNLVPLYKTTFSSTDELGYTDYRCDFLGSWIIRLIKRIKKYAIYTYMGHEPLTTIAYKAYGNTTATWIIMIYNGISSPLEIIPGSIIKLPDITGLTQAIKSAQSSGAIKTSNVGKNVII